MFRLGQGPLRIGLWYPTTLAQVVEKLLLRDGEMLSVLACESLHRVDIPFSPLVLTRRATVSIHQKLTLLKNQGQW